MKKRRALPTVNLTRLTRRDPTRTGTMLRAHISVLRRQFAALRGRILAEFREGGQFATNAFNPDQPRNPDGTFAGGGVHDVAEHELLPRTHLERARAVRDKFKAEVAKVTDAPVLRQVKSASAFCKKLTGKMYAGLSSRYGRSAAMAIMASGQAVGWGSTAAGALAGVPIFLPGSSLWGALPGVALAETILQVSKLARRAMAHNAELDIEALGQEFWDDLVRKYRAYFKGVQRTYLLNAFDPSQARDEHGRWTRSGDVVADIKGHLASQTHLAPEQREAYSKAVDLVTSRMPENARARLADHVHEITWHATTADLGKSMATKSSVIAEALKRGATVNGSYSPKSRTLNLDGNVARRAGDDLWNKDRVNVHETYAHEMAHAIDGPNFEHSHGIEWKRAWAEEIVGFQGEPPALSKYAQGVSHEGWAEFGRLVYGTRTPHEQIKAKFPKCFDYWQRHGLI